MPLLREVWFWPPTGFVDRRWSHGTAFDSPDADTFLRQSRAVCERYCEALPALAVTHGTSHLRLFLADPDDDRLTVPGPDDAPTAAFLGGPRTGFEMGLVRLPARWRHRPDDRRREDILGVVHASVMLMADERRLEGRDRLVQAVEHVRAHGYGYTWDGPWTRSPRRGPFAARARFRLADDGHGRVSVEVASLGSDGTPVATASTSEYRTWGTAGIRFRSFARTMRWRGPDVLSLDAGLALDDVAELCVWVSGGPGSPPQVGEVLGPPLPEKPSRTATERAVTVDVPADADAQRRLVTSAKVTDRLAAALDGRTTPDVVETLAADPSVKVREAVARRASAPPDLLARMAGDPDRRVREAVATNPATSAETVVLLASDPAWQVHYPAADRDDLPREVLLRLCRDGIPAVREYLASKHGADEEVALVLAADDVPAVRIALARAVGVHPTARAVLEQDPNRTVRTAVRR